MLKVQERSQTCFFFVKPRKISVAVPWDAICSRNNPSSRCTSEINQNHRKHKVYKMNWAISRVDQIHWIYVYIHRGLWFSTLPQKVLQQMLQNDFYNSNVCLTTPISIGETSNTNLHLIKVTGLLILQSKHANLYFCHKQLRSWKCPSFCQLIVTHAARCRYLKSIIPLAFCLESAKLCSTVISQLYSNKCINFHTCRRQLVLHSTKYLGEILYMDWTIDSNNKRHSKI